MAISFKGAHFPPDIILMGVRWYVAYPLSYESREMLGIRLPPASHQPQCPCPGTSSNSRRSINPSNHVTLPTGFS